MAGPGTRRLRLFRAASAHCLGIANAIHPDANFNAGLSLATSLIGGIGVTAAALILAIRRLQGYAIAGDPAQKSKISILRTVPCSASPGTRADNSKKFRLPGR